MPKIPFWIFLLLTVLYFSAARVDIMDIDASQYAEISREMAQSSDYLHIYDRGANYLDKPPFLFWVSSTSMKVFGVNNFSYRFPSILFALLALYATYRLTRILYDEATGRMAALVLGVCQGMFLMTNDVRTDTILMAWVITAIWMIKSCEVYGRKWYYVLGGTLAIACGMMTKGPIALMVPLFCFGSDWVLRRKWKLLFNPWHLFDIALIAVFLIPMCIGLYQQYDLHPEKIMDGKTGTSGLRFFFWTQSFGRITGESSWNNGADLSFLFINMLWAFLPWIFLFIAALTVNIKELFQQKFKLNEKQEWISTGGFILAYLALGSSHYQLPHYIFVAFPLAAIMVAKLLRDFLQEGKYPKLYRFFKPLQTIAGALLLIGVLLILTIVFPAGIIGICLWLIAVIIWLIIALRKQLQGKILWTSAVAMILVNVFLTHHFYYNLLHYQVGSQAGKFIHDRKIEKDHFVAWQVHDAMSCINYYAQQTVFIKDTGAIDTHSGDYILTMDDGLKTLQTKGIIYELLLKKEQFKVSELTPDFLNKRTRYKATKPYYILRIK